MLFLRYTGFFYEKRSGKKLTEFNRIKPISLWGKTWFYNPWRWYLLKIIVGV